MECRFHPDREAYITCQKMQIGYCQECLENCEACTDPCGYCRFRTQCIIWELCKKSEKSDRLKREEKGSTPGKMSGHSAASDYSRSIKGILFDFDGTLTLPGALDFPAIKQEMNCPRDMPILEFIETQPGERRTFLLEILKLREARAAIESHPNVGAEKCLSELKRRGILMGIHTRNSLQSVQQALEKFQSTRMEDFTAILTREDALPKPHPDGVIKASYIMGITVAELMVVGDFRFDIIAGNAAGACTVLLTNGKEPVLPSGDPEPEYVINRLEELLSLIELCQSEGKLRVSSQLD